MIHTYEGIANIAFFRIKMCSLISTLFRLFDGVVYSWI